MKVSFADNGNLRNTFFIVTLEVCLTLISQTVCGLLFPFWPCGMRDLSSLTKDETCAP